MSNPAFGMDPRAVEEAEAGLAALSAHYPAMAAEEIRGLRAAWAAIAAGLPPEETSRLSDGMRGIAHNLKGEGGSCGYPMVSTIAASLCLLLDHGYALKPGTRPAVEAHLQALEAVLGARMAGPGGAAGRNLLLGLRDRVADCAVAAAG